MKQSAKRRTSPRPRSTCPSSSAPAFEVMFPPSKPATTDRRSTASNSSSFGVHSVCIGAHLGSWRNRCRNTILADSQPRCTSRGCEIQARGDAGVDDAYRHRGRGADGRGEPPMTPIAPLITHFLREHMPVERGYSPHTCETYAHAFRLLFVFASERLKQRPSQLCLEQIDAALVLNFLT